VATYGDIPELMSFGPNYSKEIYPEFEYDENVLFENVVNCIDNPNIAFWIYRENDEAVGTAAFVLAKPFSGGPLTAMEIMWYIVPELRGGGRGKALLLAVEEELRGMGAETVQVSRTAVLMPKTIEAILVGGGYEPYERSFRKQLNEASTHERDGG